MATSMRLTMYTGFYFDLFGWCALSALSGTLLAASLWRWRERQWRK
jgi:hypothetical protein